MGPRTLEARLTARLLATAIGAVVSVGVLGAVVTERTLAASDAERARSAAAGAHEALAVELAEGDPPSEAVRDVLAGSEAEGTQVSIGLPTGQRVSTKRGALPEVSPGTCEVVTGAGGEPWLACAHRDRATPIVAAVPLAAHRAAVAAVWRAIAVLLVVSLLALAFAVRKVLRGPLGELTALARWAGSVRETERAEAPPLTTSAETLALSTALDALVRELLAALASARANGAHVAHELRTPLTAIAAELDAMGLRAPSEHDALARVRGDVQRLADAIDAILVLSDRAPPGPREIVNVADVARELSPTGAAVEAPDEALVEGDERLVRLALRNLIDNASRYGGGATAVRVVRAHGGVRLVVVDEGRGLAADARAQMFQRYWRGVADGDGRGLGLALVRAVAERHGGTAAAEPGPGGRGLEVGLTLGPAARWDSLGSG